MPECPHKHTQFCPLYIAAHAAGLPTCMGDWDTEGCDVDHGRVRYEETVASLFRADASIISEAALAEARFEAREQRARNTSLLGLH